MNGQNVVLGQALVRQLELVSANHLAARRALVVNVGAVVPQTRHTLSPICNSKMSTSGFMTNLVEKPPGGSSQYTILQLQCAPRRTDKPPRPTATHHLRHAYVHWNRQSRLFAMRSCIHNDRLCDLPHYHLRKAQSPLDNSIQSVVLCSPKAATNVP